MEAAVRIVEDGAYVGDPAWPALVASLKQEPTTVRRVEVGLGSAGTTDFENIEALIEWEGTGPGTILYRNFQALRDTLPGVDAFNYDDESNAQRAAQLVEKLIVEAVHV